MQITRATEYAIRIILELALRNGSSEPVAIADISEKQDIPVKYFRKLIIHLINAGLVRSYRGPKGGLMLAKPPEEITVYDVIKVSEGEMYLNVCLISDDECGRQKFCPVHEVWEDTQRAMLSVLDGVNFKTLAERNNQLNRTS